jgi:4-diphosphocytidyl-2-C-methyl-D-erythritol kinase
MRLIAPAKINLHLRVGPLSAAEGFHPVLTWMCTVALFDTLSFTRIEAPGLRFECDDPKLPTDGRNLVVRATELIADHKFTTGLGISLEKRIPSGAGLGGGSSDAARTLLGVNQFLKLGRSVSDLAKLAAQLGSDVPFFLHGPSSVCTGRGEIVKPIRRPTPRFAVLVLPGVHVPTPSVYRRFDEMNLGDARAFADGSSQPDWRDWSDLSADQLLPRLTNDLEPAAFSLEPALARLHGEVQAVLGDRPVRMSGSGSSLFTLFDDRPGADEAAAKLASARPDVRSLAVELAPDVDDDLSSNGKRART